METWAFPLQFNFNFMEAHLTTLHIDKAKVAQIQDFEDGKEKDARETTRKLTRETLTKLNNFFRKLDIKTRDSRQKFKKFLQETYEQKVPDNIKKRINAAIVFIDKVENGIMDGVSDFKTEQQLNKAKLELYNILFNPLHKIKEGEEGDQELSFEEQFVDEIDRVVGSLEKNRLENQSIDNQSAVVQ